MLKLTRLFADDNSLLQAATGLAYEADIINHGFDKLSSTNSKLKQTYLLLKILRLFISLFLVIPFKIF